MGSRAMSGPVRCTQQHGVSLCAAQAVQLGGRQASNWVTGIIRFRFFPGSPHMGHQGPLTPQPFPPSLGSPVWQCQFTQAAHRGSITAGGEGQELALLLHGQSGVHHLRWGGWGGLIRTQKRVSAWVIKLMPSMNADGRKFCFWHLRPR